MELVKSVKSHGYRSQVRWSPDFLPTLLPLCVAHLMARSDEVADEAVEKVQGVVLGGGFQLAGEGDEGSYAPLFRHAGDRLGLDGGRDPDERVDPAGRYSGEVERPSPKRAPRGAGSRPSPTPRR